MTTEVNTVASSQPFAPRSRGGVALRLTAVDEVGLEARAKTFATRSIKTRSHTDVERLVRGQADEQSPYTIADFCEMKTVWHPVDR